MDCSFGEALQEGGCEHLMVMAWISDRAVQATLDIGCSELLFHVDLALKASVTKARPLTMTCIMGGEMHSESCYLLLKVMEFQDKLRVGLALALACEMILSCEGDPIYMVLEQVRAMEEERKCLRRSKGWAGEVNPHQGGDKQACIDLDQVASVAQC